jgi:hypothetical protein
MLNKTTLTSQYDDAFTDSMMLYCRQELGSRCVLENYSTRTADLGPDFDHMYASIVSAGPPLAYQTAIDSRVGDLDETLCADLSTRKAADVELPRGYDDPADPYGVYRTSDQLAPFNQALLAASRTCPG